MENNQTKILAAVLIDFNKECFVCVILFLASLAAFVMNLYQFINYEFFCINFMLCIAFFIISFNLSLRTIKLINAISGIKSLIKSLEKIGKIHEKNN